MDSSGTKRNALWGSSRRGIALVAAAAALALAGAGPTAAGVNRLAGGPSSSTSTTKAWMTKRLRSASTTKPSADFEVIVMGARGTSTGDVVSVITAVKNSTPGNSYGVRRQFDVVRGATAQLTGSQILSLQQNPKILSVVENAQVARMNLSNLQLWPGAAGVSPLWGAVPGGPAIAVVDSGVDSARAADFGARVIAQQNFVTNSQNRNTAGDTFGHGTLVAGIAAGEATGYTGAAPGANIVSLDVFDDVGSGTVGDVIAAADWIYKNKDKYNIRVANFSLSGSTEASFMYDPLDQAAEKLWLSGVVVVTAAGNYGDTVSGVRYAPANDPFVITVGASDIAGTVPTTDDFAAPWSARGYTPDGFLKPDVGAPGRYINGPAPAAGWMYVNHPERIVAPGYMWMSGTSFAAAVVSGAAADILALQPTWTPDQVKGALMVAALPYASAAPYSLGVGVVSGQAAASVFAPPNPNASLDNYVTADPSGGRTFDAASWSSAAQADASWNTASWSSASWSSASWSSASWSSASWSSASWSSASWSSGTMSDGTLSSASWSSLTWVQ
jgi:serine protease AprX